MQESFCGVRFFQRLPDFQVSFDPDFELPQDGEASPSNQYMQLSDFYHQNIEKPMSNSVKDHWNQKSSEEDQEFVLAFAPVKVPVKSFQYVQSLNLDDVINPSLKYPSIPNQYDDSNENIRSLSKFNHPLINGYKGVKVTEKLLEEAKETSGEVKLSISIEEVEDVTEEPIIPTTEESVISVDIM